MLVLRSLNHTKSSAKSFIHKLESVNADLFFHCEVFWPSFENALSRLFDIWKCVFLCRAKAGYSSHILTEIKQMNLSLHDVEQDSLSTHPKIQTFIEKIKIWNIWLNDFSAEEDLENFNLKCLWSNRSLYSMIQWHIRRTYERNHKLWLIWSNQSNF